jgi:hypothetical protein
MRWWIAIPLSWLFLATSAFAENRLALVIGNDDYQHIDKLQRPRPMRRLMRRFCARRGSRFRRAMTSLCYHGRRGDYRARSTSQDGLGQIKYRPTPNPPEPHQTRLSTPP